MISIRVAGGKKSFWNNLPCENVSIVDDYHVDISLDDVINHMMAHGIPLSYLQDKNKNRNCDGINGCPAADELLEKLMRIVKAAGRYDPDKTAFGYLIFWSDGFMTAFVKQKGNSCWVMTHTHCIAIGRKEGDHNKVIVKKLEELEDIRKGKWRYNGGKKDWVFTSFDIIVYMADRPERNDILRTLGHTGLSAKRFRYAAFTNSRVLESCNKCYENLI